MAATLFAGIAAELAVRAFHAAPRLELDIYRMPEPGLLLLRPNIERRHVAPRWDVWIRTNSDGWRDDEGAAAAVLALGDSMTFGWGVKAGETFPALVEERIGVEVLNAGVPGTGPLDYARMAELLTPELMPQIVVTGIFIGNDFYDAEHGGGATFVVEDGLLGRRGETPAWRSRLVRSSHLLQALRAIQFQVIGSYGDKRVWDSYLREFAQIHLVRGADAFNSMFEALVNLLRAVRGANAELVLVLIPRSFQVDPDEREEMMAALGVTGADLDMDRPQRAIRAWASENGVHVADPLEEFRTRAASGKALFFSPDAHMTPAGHQAVADALYPLLVGYSGNPQ